MMTALLLANLLFAKAASITSTSLGGTYHRACYVVDTDALTTELSIEGNHWKLQHYAYEDEKCDTPYLIYELDYKVQSENSHDIDMTTVEASYMTLSDEVSRALNQVHYCGFTDWKKKVRKVVTGKLCDEYHVPASGDMIYSIINVKQNGDLYLGTASGSADGKTPEGRHTQVDPLPLVKQKN